MYTEYTSYHIRILYMYGDICILSILVTTLGYFI